MKKIKRYKKVNAIIASILFLSGICAGKYIPSVFNNFSYTISADDSIYEDFTYTVDENGFVEITGYTNDTATSVVIPDEIEGKKVVSIGKSAFEKHPALEKLTISDNVESIGQRAFYKCFSLNYIQLGRNVKNIDKYAFSLCEENGIFASYDEKQINKLIIPENLQNMHQNAFFYANVEELIIPDYVTDINQQLLAFTVGKISLDENNQNFVLQDDALYDRDITELKKYSKNAHGDFYLPSTVKTIRFDAFNYCSNLTGIHLASYDSDGNDISQLETIEDYAFFECTQLSNIEFGRNVKSVGVNAFGMLYSTHTIDSVLLPDDLGSVDSTSFHLCNFTKLTVPATCTKINSVFLNNEQLSTIEVDSNNEVYVSFNNILYSKDKSTLIKCPANSKIKEYIVLPEVTTIEQEAFSSCETLQKVDLRNNGNGNVTEIKQSAFYACTHLSTLDLGQKMNKIGAYAFSMYDKPITYGTTIIYQTILLEDLTIPDDLKDIDERAFYHCDIANVHIPSSVVSIHERFYCDTKTNSFNVNSDNQYFSSENGVLYNKDKTVLIKCPHASAITSFTVPNTVNTIKSFSFNGVKLQSITIPENTSNLEKDIFYDTELKVIYGFENSAAQSYAQQNNFEFFALDSLDNIQPGNKFDLNNDGKVNVFDIIEIRKYVLKKTED